MLKDSFYHVTQLSGNSDENVFSYEVNFIAENIIFEGHFPNQPVVPGVTIIQMVKELMSEAFDLPLYFDQIINTKFLQVVDPREQKIFVLESKVNKMEETYSVDVLLRNEAVIVFKMKAKMKKLS